MKEGKVVLPPLTLKGVMGSFQKGRFKDILIKGFKEKGSRCRRRLWPRIQGDDCTVWEVAIREGRVEVAKV